MGWVQHAGGHLCVPSEGCTPWVLAVRSEVPDGGVLKLGEPGALLSASPGNAPPEVLAVSEQVYLSSFFFEEVPRLDQVLWGLEPMSFRLCSQFHLCLPPSVLRAFLPSWLPLCTLAVFQRLRETLACCWPLLGGLNSSQGESLGCRKGGEPCSSESSASQLQQVQSFQTECLSRESCIGDRGKASVP